MPIILVRVDERFVHGQILEGWIPSTRADELLIANDAVAEDPLQQTIMQAAVPMSVDLVVDTVEGIAGLACSRSNGRTRSLLLVNHPKDALKLRRFGVEFDVLNLGNLRTPDVSVCLSRSVLVGDECMKVLCELAGEGVRVTIQGVPYEKAVDLADVCGRSGKSAAT